MLAKPGRPPKPLRDRRCETVLSRVKAKEASAATAAARAARITVSDLIRALLRRELAEPTIIAWLEAHPDESAS